MQSEKKEKILKLTYECEMAHPELFARRDLVFRLLAAMVITRVLFAFSSLLSFGEDFFPLFDYAEIAIWHLGIDRMHMPTVGLILMFAMVIIVFALSCLIYCARLKLLAWVVLAIGAYSLLTQGGNALFVFIFALFMGGFYASATAALFIGTNLLQIVAMIFVLCDKKYKLYISKMAEVRKELAQSK